MNVAIFGSFGDRPLPSGWERERCLAMFGGGEFDLTGTRPGDGAHLTAVSIFGGIEIIVDPGTQVTMSGFSLFGGREVKVRPGDGPGFTLRAVAIFGGIEVEEADLDDEDDD